jgi:hypothetical protein
VQNDWREEASGEAWKEVMANALSPIARRRFT